MVHSNLGKNSDVIQKITKAKRAGSMLCPEIRPQYCQGRKEGGNLHKRTYLMVSFV
jgi:hypothetical protein